MATKDNKNIQRDKFFLTINSPLTYGYTHQEIFKIAFWEFPSFRYAAVVDESQYLEPRLKRACEVT